MEHPIPTTTIVISPRERFDVAVRSLESVIAYTNVPHRLLYVLAGGTRAERRRIESLCGRPGYGVVPVPSATTPNEARNEGLRRVDTELVAFLDNDVVVSPGWLEALEGRLRADEAVAATPLLFQGDAERGEIHLAGGFISLEGEHPNRTFRDEHRLQGRHVDEVVAELVPSDCDFVEFHCCLVRTDAVRAIGGCDEGLRNTREHIDLSWALAAAGGRLVFEPAARVAYHTPRAIRARDSLYFLRRWSDGRTRASLEHFTEKWGIDPAYVQKHSTRFRRDVVLRPWARRLGGWAGPRGEGAVLRVLRGVERRASAGPLSN